MPTKLIERAPSAYYFPLLIKNILRAPMIFSSKQQIVYRDIMRYDYTTLNERIAQLANALTQMGVKAGDTVAMMDWDSHRYLECFFAVPMMGAILHTVNIRLSPEQLIYTINHAEDDVILVNSDFLPLLEAVKDQFTAVKKIILITDSDQKPDTSLSLDGEYEEVLAAGSNSFNFPDFDENSRATTFYTTGTTGQPKGVCFSHRQLVLHTYGLMSGLCVNESPRLGSSDVYMPLTPMFHVHAWGLPYLFTMLGTKQIYPGRYEPEMLLKLVIGEKVTFSHCVPTILHMIVGSLAIKQLDLSKWKVIIGGSALSQGLCRAALENKIDLWTAYGMSETCPLLTAAILKPNMLEMNLEKQVETRCRTGLPVPNVDLKIIDIDGNQLPHDGKTVGEVVVRAPWLTQGYLKDPVRSEELWKDGWLHTGDIGYITPDEYLQITDRIKDVIKTGGEWISSLELEDIISQHPDVSEAAVVGVPDSKWGERPVALVVLKETAEKTTTSEELKAFFSKSAQEGVIPKYGVPDRVLIVDTIPKTSVGKINKKQIRNDLKQS